MPTVLPICLHIISCAVNNKEHYSIIPKVKHCIFIKNWLSCLSEFLSPRFICSCSNT